MNTLLTSLGFLLITFFVSLFGYHFISSWKNDLPGTDSRYTFIMYLCGNDCKTIREGDKLNVHNKCTLYATAIDNNFADHTIL